jgi:hypothetical protein
MEGEMGQAQELIYALMAQLSGWLFRATSDLMLLARARSVSGG